MSLLSIAALQTTQEATQGRSYASVTSPPGQLEQQVSRWPLCKMQEQDTAGQETRKKREMNALLRNFAHETGETPATLQAQVDKLLADHLFTNVTCADAKRQQRGSKDTAQGIVVVQFKQKSHKTTV